MDTPSTFPSALRYGPRQDAITHDQNNHFTNNRFVGDWMLNVYEQGRYVSMSTWQGSPYRQDGGSVTGGRHLPAGDPVLLAKHGPAVGSPGVEHQNFWSDYP